MLWYLLLLLQAEYVVPGSCHLQLAGRWSRARFHTVLLLQCSQDTAQVVGEPLKGRFRLPESIRTLQRAKGAPLERVADTTLGMEGLAPQAVGRMLTAGIGESASTHTDGNINCTRDKVHRTAPRSGEATAVPQ